MERVSKPKRRLPRKRRVRDGRRPEDTALMTGLMHELYNVVSDAGLALGVTRKQQRDAWDLATQSRKRRRPSATVLKSQLGVSLIIATWRHDARYTQNGAPKVLPILGKGASLESLVKKCAPQLPIPEAVRLLCSQSDVTKMKGDRVALLGNPVNIMEKTPETILAWMISQLRHLAETTVHNSTIPANNKSGGRFERQVYGVLSKRAFDAWSQTVRERLQETSDRVEEELGNDIRAMLSGRQKICGVSLFVFREDGKLG
jgi:hypothetical protein